MMDVQLYVEKVLHRIVRVCAVALFLFAATLSDAHAQELEPRGYANLPVGLNFIVMGYGYTEGDVLSNPSVALENIEAEIHTSVIAYLRTINIWGRSGRIQTVLPYAWLSARGDLAGPTKEREVSGFTDPSLRLSVNLYGGPALSLDEFANYEPDTTVGLSFLVTAPYGDYDSDKLANIGTNRWSFKPEIGISKALGSWILELATGVYMYTDNDDFFGGHKREQDPIYSVQGHAIYHFRRGVWSSLSTTYYTGGRTTIDGIKKDDLQDNWRFGITLALPVDRRNSIKIYGSTGVHTRISTDFDAFGIAWQYRWGEGL
jgi:hypothetical protein